MHPVPDDVMRHYETILKMHEIPLNLYAEKIQEVAEVFL